jgi:hypothetical protein
MFRLVIAVSPASGLDRDALAEIEDRLIRALAQRHPVRDHDLGRGHLKIVVHTDDPQGAWGAAKAAIPEAALPEVDAFYSVMGDRKEHSLWPPLPGPPPTQGDG